jgi:quinolinate synthase
MFPQTLFKPLKSQALSTRPSHALEFSSHTNFHRSWPTLFPQLHHVKRPVLATTKSAAAPAVDAQPSAPPASLEHIITEFTSLSDPRERSKLLIQKYAKQLPSMDDTLKTRENRVMGCTAQVWVSASLDSTNGGTVTFTGDSDSEITRGLCAILVKSLSGLTPHQIRNVPSSSLQQIAALASPGGLARSRTNGFLNMLETMKKKAAQLELQSSSTTTTMNALPAFPSLIIKADGASAQGAYAEAQAAFLTPDPATVTQLVHLLSTKKIGVVAHFYMDPQVQGVLSAAAKEWAHIKISDSLVMADGAVAMAEAGCSTIVVLGVDFMSENVRAILDEAGHSGVDVYRMASDPIGCSLAEAAESPEYDSYLNEASKTPNSLHVVYINTSLKTKAVAHSMVPTITCTSSNVVNTVLTAFAQVPGSHVWYGPDSYMGANLAALFTSLAGLTDEEVKQVHLSHTVASIKSLLPRLRYFQNGTCIVHHLFGEEVCDIVRRGYPDAYLTAHFEVPGEMFSLAMEAKRSRDMGVVGSTQNILDFIAARVGEALERPHPDRLQFVLGTETGMITSIVLKVQELLKKAGGRQDVEVEIVFPVSSDAITTESTMASATTATGGVLPGGLAVVPGPASGEGCSSEGGCASCPYMKMNNLQALLTVCQRVGDAAGGSAMLEGYKPKAYADKVGGKSMARAGCEPILHMRGFQKMGRLPDDLVVDITTRY